MSKIHYTKDMTKCPYCGSEEFYIKQSYKGYIEYKMRFDKDENKVTNYELYENATHTNLTKYAYCRECEKRLFPIEEYYEALQEK